MYTASLLVFMGCISLSLSIKKHYVSTIDQSIFSNEYSIMLLRLCGFFCLLFSFILFFRAQGIALGLVYLAATFTVASLIQTLLLSYLNSWINKISLVLALTITVLTLHEESTQFQILLAYLG